MKKPNINVFELNVMKTASQDMLMKAHVPSPTGNRPPFVWSFNQWCRTHPDDAKKILNISHVFAQRDPKDPTLQSFELGATGFEKFYPIYLCIVDPVNFDQNTAANRNKWGLNFVRFFNSNPIQRLFKFPQRAHYNGDLTPQDETKAAPLGRYLTINDTMLIARAACVNQDDPGVEATVQQVLANAEVMECYFGKDLVEMARNTFNADPADALDGPSKGEDEDNPNLIGEGEQTFSFD